MKKVYFVIKLAINSTGDEIDYDYYEMIAAESEDDAERIAQETDDSKEPAPDGYKIQYFAREDLCNDFYVNEYGEICPQE